jgi:hypothetical protein
MRISDPLNHRIFEASNLGKQGIPWEVFQAARKPVSEAHNRPETPLFAMSIERHALRKK